MRRNGTLISAALASIVLAGAAPAGAADAMAGKETAEICAACHGANGISVSDDIPNLAGQNATYLQSQLEAFREGDRANALMNAIAGQLGDTEIENVVAFFSELPGAAGTAKSELLPHLSADRLSFPKEFPDGYTHYTTISFPDRKQVRRYYANAAALAAAREGGSLPDGSLLLVEIFKAKLDADGKPINGEDGHFQPGALAAYTAMGKHDGWGDSVPELLRNGDWSYAVFGADKSLKGDVNEAKCLACHKPEADMGYVFSLPELTVKAATAR